MPPDVLFEVLCRGPERCGMFVSAAEVDACPRCGSRKVRIRRVVAEPSAGPSAPQ